MTSVPEASGKPAPPGAPASPEANPEKQGGIDEGPRMVLRLLEWIAISLGAAYLVSAAFAAGGLSRTSHWGTALHFVLALGLLLLTIYLFSLRPLLGRIRSLDADKQLLLQNERTLQGGIANRRLELSDLKRKLESETASKRAGEEAAQRVQRELEQHLAERTAQLEGARREWEAERADQKKLTEVLRESEKRYRRLVEIAREGVWTLNAEGKTNFMNRFGAELLGFSIPEVLERAPESLIVLEDLPSELRKLDFQERPSESGLEFRMRRKDGGERWMRSSVSSIIGDRGDYLGALIVFDDITERKQSEQQLQEQVALLDLAQDAVVMCNPSLHILSWNGGATRLFGWSSQEVLGRDAYELLAARDPAGPKEQLLQLLQRECAQRAEWTVRPRDGRSLVLDVRLNLAMPAAGRPGSILLVATDVTAQREQESNRIRRERLESATALATGLSQELNNSLSPVLLSAQILRSKKLDSEDQGLVAAIESSARRSVELLKQTLVFARGTDGERVSVDPARLLQDIKDIAQETFPRNIQVLLLVDRDTPVCKGDPAQLHQVLLKLVVFARDAMPSGGTLWLKAKMGVRKPGPPGATTSTPVGPCAVLSVQDTGTSLPPGAAERLFEPFFSAKSDGSNAGLGLSAALGIIRSHGGDIQVQAHSGGGTLFEVWLPAAAGPSGFARPSVEDNTGRGECILMIEDEAALREVTRKALARYGYEVLAAGNGAEALGLLNQHPGRVRLVLTSLVAGTTDGPALAQAARNIDPQVRIIASSALGKSFGEAEKLTALRSVGITRLLPKPYSAEELLKAVREELDQARSPRR